MQVVEFRVIYLRAFNRISCNYVNVELPYIKNVFPCANVFVIKLLKAFLLRNDVGQDMKR